MLLLQSTLPYKTRWCRNKICNIDHFHVQCVESHKWAPLPSAPISAGIFSKNIIDHRIWVWGFPKVFLADNLVELAFWPAICIWDFAKSLLDVGHHSCQYLQFRRNNLRDRYIEHHLKISDYNNNPNASWTSLKTPFVGKIENWGAQFKFVLIILSFCWLDLNLNIQKIDFSPGQQKKI